MDSLKKHIIFLDSVDSTNNYAKQLLARQTVPEGTLILAGSQTAGMGLGTNTWESEPGKNLTFSIIFHPVFLAIEKQFFFNQAISLGIVDFFNLMINDGGISLKWPNDIYFHSKKMGGILIQNSVSGQVFEHAVVGIGLNINQDRFLEKIPNPVSLKQILNQDTDLNFALDLVFNSIETRYIQLRNGHFRKLRKDYSDHLLGFEIWRNYFSGEKRFEGMIKGVTEFGRLLVENRLGEILEFDHKEIEYML